MDLSFLQSPLSILLITAALTAIGAYMRKLQNKIDLMITAYDVKELLQDKLALVDVQTESTKDRLSRIEDNINRVEEKIDKLLSRRTK